MKDITKEEKELLQALSQRASLPDPKFKSALKAKVVKEYNKESTILGKLAFFFGSLAVLSFILVILGGDFLNNFSPTIQTINTTFTNEEKKSVYQNILKNNPLKVVQASVSTQSPTSATSKQVSETEIATVQQKYTQNYYLAEYSTLTQVFNNQCANIQIVAGTTTFTEYRDKDNYFSKIVTKNLNNSISSYNLTKVKGNILEEYMYNGSGSVIKQTSNFEPGVIVQEVPVSAPVSYTTSSEEESFFEGTILDQKIKKNGEEYYVLKTESLAECEDIASYPVSYASEKTKVITLSYFNAENFVLELTEAYLNQTTNSNLLYSQTFLKREKQVDLLKIEREFEYDLTLTVENAVLPVSYTKK